VKIDFVDGSKPLGKKGTTFKEFSLGGSPSAKGMSSKPTKSISPKLQRRPTMVHEFKLGVKNSRQSPEKSPKKQQ
jgi:hypothetical protein